MKTTETVYISHLALTKGIYKDEVTIGKYSAWNDEHTYRGGQWHKTKEEAIHRAEQLRKTRIESLEKKIEEIQNLNFEQEAAK